MLSICRHKDHLHVHAVPRLSQQPHWYTPLQFPLVQFRHCTLPIQTFSLMPPNFVDYARPRLLQSATLIGKRRLASADIPASFCAVRRCCASHKAAGRPCRYRRLGALCVPNRVRSSAHIHVPTGYRQYGRSESMCCLPRCWFQLPVAFRVVAPRDRGERQAKR